MYFKNYTLVNIPTKLMYKHRVDYYDYTTVFHALYTANRTQGKKIITISNFGRFSGKGRHALH